MAKKSTAEAFKEEVRRTSSKTTKDTVFISTGSTIGDLVIGCGNGYGVETGTVMNIAGESGGGKSQFVMTVVACAIRDYGDKVRKRLRDTENGSNFNTKRMFGFVFEDDEVSDVRTVEEAHADINLFLEKVKPEEIAIDITDSIDGLIGAETDNEIEDRINAFARDKEYDQGSYNMGKQKYLSAKMLPDLAKKYSNRNAISLICSQTRANVGAGLYGPKQTINNGSALKFYCHTQMWIKKRQKIINNGIEIGAVVEFKITKGRGDRSYRTCLVTVYFNMGIDGISTDVDYLFDLRSDKTGELLARANKPLGFDGQVFDDRGDLIKYIDDNDKLEELKQAVTAKWDAEWATAMEPIAGRKNRFLK